MGQISKLLDVRTASLSRLARLAPMYGMADAPGEDEQKKRQSPPPVEFLRPGETQAPLPARDQTPAAWVPRPEEYQRPTSWMPPSSAAPATSNLPKVAGGLPIISAGVGRCGGMHNARAWSSVRPD